MGLHFWFLHIDPQYSISGEEAFELIKKRLSQPVWRFIDVALLVIILLHASNGLRMVLNDIVKARFLRAFIFIILLAGVVVGFCWGYDTLCAFIR
jgi:succinate dehydrogenase hydrophobic anchor subunit